MKISITARQISCRGTIDAQELSQVMTLRGFLDALLRDPASRMGAQFEVSIAGDEADEATTLDDRKAQIIEKIVGSGIAHLDPPEVLPDPPDVDLPPMPKATRLTPGPATIGVGPPPAADRSPPISELMKFLVRELPEVGDSKRLIDLATQTSDRIAIREAVEDDPRFRYECEGRGHRAWIRRVR